MEDYIRNSLRHPAEYIVPGYQPLMPEFSDDPNSPNYMPENQLEAIVAYLMTQTE